MPFTIRLFALWLAALGSPVFADTTANYVGPNAAISMKVEIASNGDVRGATSNPNSYFITRDGQGYIIQASFNGPAVMRVQDMATVMAEQMKKMMPNMPADAGKDAPAFDLVRGGTVTIRGRQGTAYYMGKSTNGALIGPPIVVISNDPALAPIGTAMQRQFDMSLAMMGHVFGAANPFKSMQEILKSGTPLVFTGMELDTVNNEPIPASRFDLPAQPLTLDGVRKNMGAAAQ